MHDVQLKLLQRCIRDLETLGCTFAIVDADNQKHGTLEVVEHKDRKAKSPFEFGAVSKYLETYLKDMKVGDVTEIPVNEYGFSRLQSVTASWFCYRYGNRSHTTTQNKDKNVLEVMRLA